MGVSRSILCQRTVTLGGTNPVIVPRSPFWSGVLSHRASNSSTTWPTVNAMVWKTRLQYDRDVHATLEQTGYGGCLGDGKNVLCSRLGGRVESE